MCFSLIGNPYAAKLQNKFPGFTCKRRQVDIYVAVREYILLNISILISYAAICLSGMDFARGFRSH